MNNFEKYKKELLEGKFGIDKNTGELKTCSELKKCIDCKLYGEKGDCVIKMIKWGFEEAKFKLNRRQQAFCEMAETGWLARDRNGDLYYYRENAPTNKNGIWYKKDYYDEAKRIDSYDMFPDFSFITHENSPFSIEELMNGGK